MKFIVLDIETKPQGDLKDLFTSNIKAPGNFKDPVKIEAALEKKRAEAETKMAVDTDFANIACIGIKVNDEPAKLVTLEELADIFNAEESWQLITFNGNKFDLPIIIKQGIKQGINLPYSDLRKGMKKYSSEFNTDLMELICDGDYKSLDMLLQVYLGIKKTEIDFTSCTDEELKAHCLEDVENTYQLYQKFKSLT